MDDDLNGALFEEGSGLLDLYLGADCLLADFIDFVVAGSFWLILLCYQNHMSSSKPQMTSELPSMINY